MRHLVSAEQIQCPVPHQMLDAWADQYPDHVFILAPAGSHRILDAWEMARGRENVYLDLAHTLHYFRGSSVEKDNGYVHHGIKVDQAAVGLQSVE